jgi:hypothetical protein
MHHPDLGADLQSVDQPIGVSPVTQRQFQNARTKPRQGFGNIRHPAFGNDGQGARQIDLCALREILEHLPRSLYPGNLPRVPSHP